MSTRIAIFVIIVIVAFGLNFAFEYGRMSAAALRETNKAVNLLGKNAIVIGGTNGIGKGIALRLAQANVAVTIGGRSEASAKETITEMQALSTSAAVKHDFKKIDASLMSQVASFTDDYAKTHDKLDFLVCTQGIATMQGYTPTIEGIDQKLAIHYFGRVLSAQRLMPLLEKSESPRVLFVLSPGVHGSFSEYDSDFDLAKSYSLSRAATAACMYNDIAVAAIHAAPGFVSSNWGTEMPWAVRMLVRAIQPFGTSIRDIGYVMCDWPSLVECMCVQ
jgi:NAD(P)-dependent dehydrogenase (short-subunit alcohol dehydrogenase family)